MGTDTEDDVLVTGGIGRENGLEKAKPGDEDEDGGAGEGQFVFAETEPGVSAEGGPFRDLNGDRGCLVWCDGLCHGVRR